jgi:large repetitive protein
MRPLLIKISFAGILLIFASIMAKAQCPAPAATVVEVCNDPSENGILRAYFFGGAAPESYLLFSVNENAYVTEPLGPVTVNSGIALIPGAVAGVEFALVPDGDYIIRANCLGGGFITVGGIGITVNSGDAISAGVTVDPDCNPASGGGNADGSITLNISGGIAPYDISWPTAVTAIAGVNNAGAGMHSFLNLDGGLYTVEILDDNNCLFTVDIEVPASTMPVAGPDQTVCGFSATLDANPAGAGETGTWTGPPGVTFDDDNSPTAVASGLSAGVNLLRWTLHDAGGTCPGNFDEVEVLVSAPMNLSTTVTDVACNGAATGSIDLLVADGIAPYTFLWSNGAATEDLANIPAGTYSVTVTDDASCLAVLTDIIVAEPPTPVSGSTSQVDVACFGGSTGSITLTGVGGVGPYDFSIDAGGSYPVLDDPDSEHIFNGLAAGDYDLMVRDANGCESPAIPVTITQPLAVSGTTTQVNVQCFGAGTGSITITGVGGVTPYDFSIDGGTTYAALDAPDQTFPNLPAGDYDLMVRDANGCASPLIEVTITQPVAGVTGSTTEVDVLCFGESTGSITITGSGGVGPYDFSIDGGGNYTAMDVASHVFPGLAADTYDLTVRDANGCESALIQVAITQPASAVSATIGQVDVLCAGATTGSITVTGAGGVGPYDFSIDGGGSYPEPDVPSHTFTGLTAGPYSIRVRDANGCETAVIPVTITEPATAVSGSTSQADVLCFGGGTGSITITGAGGVGPYDFSIDGGATYPEVDLLDHTFPNLTAGLYNLQVRDANGCESPLIPVTIAEPAAAVSGSTSQTDVLCFGATTGSITVTGAGGAGPYDFSIDGGGSYPVLAASDHTFSNLAADTYDLMVRDAAGCESPLIQVVITQPLTAVSGTTTQVDVTCFGATTGSISITGAGGVGPYDFSIDGGNTYPVLASPDNTFSNLPAGTHNLMVRDDNGCETAVIPITIAQPSAAVTGSTTQVNVTCFGQNTGAITITGAGGVGPYDFSIDGGGSYEGVASPDHTFSSLAAGVYSLMVKDANGCESAGVPVTITQPAEVTAVVSAVGATTVCEGDVLPDIVFTFTGTAPFDFTFTDGTTPVNVTDHLTSTYTIAAAPAGTYEITALADDNGCVATNVGAPIVVTEETAPTAEAGNTQIICSGQSATLSGSVVGGSAVTGAWSIVSEPTGGDGALLDETQTANPDGVTFTATVAGTYTLRLTTNDPGGLCDAVTDDVVITVTAAATVDAGPAQTICAGGTVTLAATFSGTTGILWTTSGNGSFDNPASQNAVYTPDATDIVNGTVTLTAETQGPCAQVQDIVLITIDPAPTVDAGSPATICSSASVVLNASFGGSATGLVWTTDGNGTFNDLNDPSATYTPGSDDITDGTVALTATATGSCAGTFDEVIVTVDPAATVEAGDAQTVCFGSDVTLDATLGGSAATMTWVSSGDGVFDDATDPNAVYTPSANDLANGSVTLTATTDNPAGPCPAAQDNVVITFIAIPGDQTTAGNDTWIGYVYDDAGDTGTIPEKIDFDNAKYRGFISETDIATMSPASSYDGGTDAFDLNLDISDAIHGPNVCGPYINNFSIRYKISKTLNAGIYRFTVGGDDGVRLLIDGVNVLPPEAFDLHGYTTYTSEPRCLTAGVHELEIHYFDNTAQSRLTFTYEEVPALSTNSPVAACVDSPAPTLTVSSPDPDIIGYNWYKGGVLTFAGASYTPSAADLDMSVAATTNFSVTAVYDCGETEPVTVVVDVINSASLVINPATICESGGVVDLRTLVTETPAGGDFIFSGHAAITGNDFDPTGLAGIFSITVDYSVGSCVAPQGILDLTITNSATTTVPATPVVVCEISPDIDLTTMVSAVPAGGVFSFAGTQVAGSSFDPTGLSGLQTITVDYSHGGCVALQATFDIDVTSDVSITVSNTTACENGSPVNLLSLVMPEPAGGNFTFTGTGVSGSLFNPSGQSGLINISVDYDFNGCVAAETIGVTVVDATDPLCTGGNCASVVIIPMPEPATCTNSDGRLVMSIEPFTPVVNNTGIKITIDGISSTNLPISRTIFNENTFEGLPVGQYNYTIEYGDPSCIKAGQFSIDQSGTVGTPVISNLVSPLCFGTATGSLTLDVPGETGNVLEWSLDGGLTDPFKPFIAGEQITGLPAGPAPSFQQVISVRRNIADVCYSAAIATIPESVPPMSATFDITAATCNGNDGAITGILAAGGNDAPFSYSIDGGQTFQASPAFNSLAGASYTLTVRDAAGCQSDFTANVTFPGFINSAISKTDADCSNGGNSGMISVAVNDPGVFEVALSTDQFNEPADGDYLPYSNPAINFNELPRGEYFVYVRSTAGACPTRSAPIKIFGVYDITFDLVPACNNNELSLALVNVTGDSNGPQVQIHVTRKLSSDPPEIINRQFPANGEIFLDRDEYAFLRTPGEYDLRIVQVQVEVLCPMSSQTIDFTVPAPLTAQVGSVSESYPDIPTGNLDITGFSGGVFPYEVRIELDSASSFSLPFHATEFEEAGINGNQQIEMAYSGIPAGRYSVEVMDAQGCVLDLVARVPLDVDIFIPNVFTPNGDGSNDVFFIRNLPQEPSVSELIITNRWGKQVFTSENYQNNWDAEGTADGIYFYRLHVADNVALTGWVEIIRGPKP